jgi:hypothetical protein
VIQMVRKQIYIPKRQQVLLKRRAKARGISEAELIRQALDRDLDGSPSHAFYHDPEAWDKIQRFMLARRMRATAAAQPYRWKREDAYEDRLNRSANRNNPRQDGKR